jgi:hypothetical protein
VGQTRHCKSRGIFFFYGTGNENHQLRTGFFVHHGIISPVKTVEFRIRMALKCHPDPARKLSTNLYDIHHC